MNKSRAALCAAALAPVLLSIGACSASVSTGSDKEYDADKVAGMVQDAQEKATPDLDASDAKCPDDVELKKGTSFECTISIEGVEAPYTVTITEVGDTSAHYDLEPAKAIISAAAVVSFLEDQADKQGLSGVTVDCGDAAIIVQDPKTTFPCTLTNGNHVQNISMLAEDLDGNVSIDSTS